MSNPIKIMQIGDGNFIRAFFDLAVERLGLQAGIVSVGATPRGQTVEKLRQQKGCFTIIERGLQQQRPYESSTTVKVIQDIINPYTEWHQFLDYAASGDLEMIVSNTTEAGIYYENIPYPTECPESYAAKLTIFLYRYFQNFKGKKKLSIVPLELIEQNGSRLREICLQHSIDWKMEASFTEWLQAIPFCNTLVDRIVVGFPKDMEKNGDPLLTVCEPYFLFVIDQREPFTDWPSDDSLPFVFDDIDQYRQRKVAVLNGSHTVLAALGRHAQCRTVKEAFTHPGIRRFVDCMVNEFIERYDVEPSYKDAVFERFLNPYIEHLLFDIQLNELSKWQSRIAPYAGTPYYNKALALGLYFMNPNKFTVRESNQNLEKLQAIHNAAGDGNTQPMAQFIEEVFFCQSKPILNEFSRINSILEDIK